ncbi:hypothetical protein ABMA28_016257 [Loxostege sticticalis]|uniref:Protein phosphatase 1 regulatory subunit 36-like n=1 Tax=Loxostege sticticalis TaxID=481309 RepID=A0ABD0T874_LOXSC
MFEDDDEDDDEYEALYENGHWKWDDTINQLVFERQDDFASQIKTIFAPIEFKDDLDLMEQDIKDVALYTAPNTILTPTVVSILHMSTTDRFIRALILYFQYYLQTADLMAQRMLELESKVRTARSFKMELEMRDNLEDLRLLVAKEYCTIILGGAELRKFHHMGPNKKISSLSKKDALVFESVLRFCLQIVWLALGRQSFNQIELEIHRMFKSQLFNMIEHKMKTDYIARMAPYERFVLLGHCVQEKQKLNMLSPLLNEILCHRPMDFRMFALGTVKLPFSPPRLRFMEEALSMNERLFQKSGVTLGILGMPRSRFDTMLREIKLGSRSPTSSSSFRTKSMSRTSRVSMRKSTLAVGQKLYNDIDIPNKHYDKEWIPEEFPTQTARPSVCNPVQRQRWMARASRLSGRHVVRKNRNIRH